MTQLQFSINFEELTEAVLSSDMNSMMKSLAVLVFNQYMEAERDDYIQAGQYERNATRKDSRNGYYPRSYTLSFGKIDLDVPRTRSGEFSTHLFNRYERMDQALVLSMMEAVINGVSTRKVTDIVEQLCGEMVSKSFVSSIMKKIDPEIEAFQQRDLSNETYRYLYVDAMYIKVREDKRIISKALYIAQAVNSKNKREIIGFKVTNVESKETWAAFFNELKDRGLNQPRLVISDAHKGLVAAINEVFVGSAWQRCTVHLLKNIVDTFPKKKSEEERKLVKRIFRVHTWEEAKDNRLAFEEYVKDNPKYDKALELIDEAFYDGLQYLNEPSAYHISLRTTNSLERLNREVRRREEVISIFPNMKSAERLIGAVLLKMHERWEKENRKFLTKSQHLMSK